MYRKRRKIKFLLITVMHTKTESRHNIKHILLYNNYKDWSLRAKPKIFWSKSL